MADPSNGQEQKDTSTHTTTVVLNSPAAKTTASLREVACSPHGQMTTSKVIGIVDGQKVQVQGRTILVGMKKKRKAKSEQHSDGVGKFPEVIGDEFIAQTLETVQEANKGYVDEELHETSFQASDKTEEQASLLSREDGVVLGEFQEETKHPKQQQQQQQQQQLPIQRQHSQYPKQRPQLRQHHQQQQPPPPPNLPYTGRQQVPVSLPAIPSACFVHQVGGLQPSTVDFLPAHQPFPLAGHVFSHIPLHFPSLVPNQQQQTSVPLTHAQTRYNYDPHNLICSQNFIQHIEWQMQVQKQQLQQQLQQQVHLLQIPYQNNVFNQPALAQQQQQQQQQQLHFVQAQQVTPKIDQPVPPDQPTNTDYQHRAQQQAQAMPQRQRKHSGSESQTPGASTQGVNLYVKHLDDGVDDNALRKMFSRFGEVVSAKVMMEGQRSRGFGFVCFARPEDAARATRDIRRKSDDLSTKNLYVAPAQRKEERQAFFREKLKSLMDGTTLCTNQENESIPQPTSKEGNSFETTITPVKIPDHSKGHIMTPAGENTPNLSEDNLNTPASDKDVSVQYTTDHPRPENLTVVSSGQSFNFNQQKNIFDLENFSLEKLTKPLLRPATCPDSIYRNSCQGHESQSEPIPDSFFDADDRSGHYKACPQQQGAPDKKQNNLNTFQATVVGDQNGLSTWLTPDLYPGMTSDLLYPKAFGDATTVIDGICFGGGHISGNFGSREAVNDWSQNVWKYKEENQVLKEEMKDTENCENLECHELVTDCIACCTDTESSSSADEEDDTEHSHKQQQQCRKNACFSSSQKGRNNSNVDCALMLKLKSCVESNPTTKIVIFQSNAETKTKTDDHNSNSTPNPRNDSNITPSAQGISLNKDLTMSRKRKRSLSVGKTEGMSAPKQAKHIHHVLMFQISC